MAWTRWRVTSNWWGTYERPRLYFCLHRLQDPQSQKWSAWVKAASSCRCWAHRIEWALSTSSQPDAAPSARARRAISLRCSPSGVGCVWTEFCWFRKLTWCMNHIAIYFARPTKSKSWVLLKLWDCWGIDYWINLAFLHQFQPPLCFLPSTFSL